VAQNFGNLVEQSQKALFGFLKTEVDLGCTFVALAKGYRTNANRELHERNKHNAIVALHAIDRFKSRLSDSDRREIEPGRSKLDRLISTLMTPTT
jgi:hypothetical protein